MTFQNDFQSARSDLDQISRAIAATISPKMIPLASSKTRTAALFAAGSYVMGIRKAPSVGCMPQILPPVIDALGDQDNRVRLAAVEALYNIARVVREGLAPYSARILEALLKATSDEDSEVDRAMAILHPLLQVTVNECKSVPPRTLVPPLLQGMRMPVSAAVLTSIQWILTLESSPLVGRFLYFILFSEIFFPVDLDPRNESSPLVGRELLWNHQEVLSLLFYHTASSSKAISERATEALDQLLERTVSELSITDSTSLESGPFPYQVDFFVFCFGKSIYPTV
jgi:hypothetical protein